jgi:hypothetical protein
LQEFISIPIPIDRVQEVYELLGRPRGATAVQPSQQQTAAQPGIDPELIARAYNESPDSMKRAFKHLAANAGRDVPMNDLAAAVGYRPKEMGGALGAFGRRWANRYGGPKPFSDRWGYDIKQQIYSMTAKMAEVIKPL